MPSSSRGPSSPIHSGFRRVRREAALNGDEALPVSHASASSCGRRAADPFTVLALAPLFVTSAFADDASLPLRVRIGLAQAGLPSRGEIDVEVADGAVILRGFTMTLEERRRAASVRLDNQVRIESGVREEPARIALGS